MLRHVEKHFDSRGLKGLAKAIAGIRQDYKERTGEDDIPLTASGQKAPKEAIPKIDLRLQTYDLLSLVRGPSAEEKEALRKRGIIFLPTHKKSLAQVVSEDPDYFWDAELSYMNLRPHLRDYVPPVPMMVGLNLEQLAIPGSFNKSQKKQLEMIERLSKKLQQEFPDARVIMLPATAYAQADKAYSAKKTGEVLFRDIFVGALDQASEGYVAGVGRDRYDSRLRVDGWSAEGSGFIGAVPAVVFLRK